MSVRSHSNRIRLLGLMTRASSSTVLNLEVRFGAGRRGVPHVSRLREWAQAAYLAHSQMHGVRRKIPAAALSLRVVTARESQQLNQYWRGKNKPTNVLSFPMSDTEVDAVTEDGAFNLGDLAICAQVVAREAKEQKKLPAAHWAHMMIHGVLHLLGYDHETSRDAIVMEALEVKVLQQFGFANPYDQSL